VEGQKTVLRFNGYETELVELGRRLDQGCPLLGVAFNFIMMTCSAFVPKHVERILWHS